MKRKVVLSWIIFLNLILCFVCSLQINLFSWYSYLQLGILAFTAVSYFVAIKEVGNKRLIAFSFLSLLYFGATYFIAPRAGLGSVVIIFFSMLSVLEISEAEFSEFAKKLLLYLILITEAGLFAISFLYRFNWEHYKSAGVNPNTLGVIFLIIPMIYFLMDENKSKIKKYTFLGLIIISAFGMINCRSRMAIVSLAVYCILIILPNKILNGKSFFILAAAVIVLGTVFPIVYVILCKSGYKVGLLGKNIFTGRQLIWFKTYLAMKLNAVYPIFGIGSNIRENVNLHSNYVGVFFNFGVIGYAIYYSFILVIIKKCSVFFKNRTVKLSLLMFLCVALVMGFTETTTTWETMILPINLGLGIALQKSKMLESKYEQ